MKVLARGSVFGLLLIKYIPSNITACYTSGFASMYTILMLSFKMTFLFIKKFKIVV